MKYFLLIAALLTTCFSFAQLPTTGLYTGTATIAVFRDTQAKVVYCSFKSCLPHSRTCCRFNFKGQYKKPTDKKIQVTTSWPGDSETIKGTLVCLSDSTFTIKLKSQPKNATACPDVQHGYQATLLRSRDWLGLVIAKNWKTSLYLQPDDSKRSIDFFTTYDVLGILETNGDWLRVEYLNDNTQRPIDVFGWVKKADLYEGVFK